MIVGITGGTGTGKTTALEALEKMGACVIDCDRLYHDMLRENGAMIDEIGTRFPGVVESGGLDRKKLGKIVFCDKNALFDLNRITHRYITGEIDKKIKAERAAGRKLFAVDAVALVESGISGMCDITVAVTAPEEKRLRRIMARDGIDRQYALMRINAQQPDEFYEENCGYVLRNDCESSEAFLIKAGAFFETILGGRE